MLMIALRDYLQGWKPPTAPESKDGQTAAEQSRRATPGPMRSQVVAKTPRDPVNRQAALVIAPAPWWARPLPPEPDLTRKETVVELKERVALAEGMVRAQREANAAATAKAEKWKQRAERAEAEAERLAGELAKVRAAWRSEREAANDLRVRVGKLEQIAKLEGWGA